MQLTKGSDLKFFIIYRILVSLSSQVNICLKTKNSLKLQHVNYDSKIPYSTLT